MALSLDLPSAALTREARSADLVLLGQKMKPGGAYNALDPGSAILKLGWPTLVVPEGLSMLRAEHVVIGWKDTREARRAVRDALPFLHRATRVTVVEACGPGEEKSALDRLDDVGRYLMNHRIKAGPKVMLEQKGSGAEQLLESPGRTRRSADHWCLRTQPPRGVDLRRYDARTARDQSDLLPHVSLISQGACPLAEVMQTPVQSISREGKQHGRSRFDLETRGKTGSRAPMDEWINQVCKLAAGDDP